jgi:hypothetical protein
MPMEIEMMNWYRLRTCARFVDDERGQHLVMVTALLVALLGISALVLDIGMLMIERRMLQNAVDAGALAAAFYLPHDEQMAQAAALQYIGYNVDGVAPADINISFRCMVSDTDQNNQPDPGTVPEICNPGNATFTCRDGRCAAMCDPDAGHTCNTSVVIASKRVKLSFAALFGLPTASAGPLRAAACGGSCGTALLTPLDLAIILDRSNSMQGPDLPNTKNAVKAVLEWLNPTRHHVALTVLGPSDPLNVCNAEWAEDGGVWLPVSLSDDYQLLSGNLDGGSLLVQTINCLNNSSVGTDLGNPMEAARQHLINDGRAGIQKAIILLTDGEANLPYFESPCAYAESKAELAKLDDIEVFTIGFGTEDSECSFDNYGSPYREKPVTNLLADMATDSADEHGHCATEEAIAAENADGDHFLCEAKSGDLEPIFKLVIEQLAGGIRLIRLPDW